MEVVQYYLNRYYVAMEAGAVASSIGHISGHIIEQIELVEEILKTAMLMKVKVPFISDVAKYNKDHHYGKLCPAATWTMC